MRHCTAKPHAKAPDFSVIVPVYHEGAALPVFLEHLFAVANGFRVEVIVVDGAPEGDSLDVLKADWLPASALPDACSGAGSTALPEFPDLHPLPELQKLRELPTSPELYASPDAARLSCVRLLRAPQGRAIQMNAGAATARGETLVFLHADTRLPQEAFSLLSAARAGGARAGSFRLGLDAGGICFRVIERLACWRNRLLKTPYGDQAQFFDAILFRSLGGYPVQPLMEDVEIMRMVRRKGGAITIIPARVSTSVRRWQDEGLLYCSMRNVCLRTLYALGVPADILSRWYRRHKRMVPDRTR